MNTRDFVMFGLGAAIGAVAVYLITKEKYEEIIQEEIDSVKDVFRKYANSENQLDLEDLSEMSEEEYNNRVNKTIQNVTPFNKKDRLVYKRTLGKLTEYDQVSADPVTKIIPKVVDMEDAENEYRESSDEPYVISVDEYNEENETHDKLTITYYNIDDTLVDERDEIIADVDSIIGNEALSRFGDGSNDPDIVYVCNERLAIDYEVIRVDKSYQETVLGIVPPKKPRRRRSNAEE